MNWNVKILLILAALCLIADVAMLIKMVSLVKKSQNDTAEHLGHKLNLYLWVTSVVSVLMAVCMILVIILK